MLVISEAIEIDYEYFYINSLINHILNNRWTFFYM